ncbi:MAG: hypothetical protein AAGI38_20875 [Bacteroidota bacterium]
MKNAFYLALAFTLIYGTACAPRELTKPYKEEKISLLYSESVGDAAKPQPWEIYNDLITIKKGTPHLIWKEIDNKTYVLVSTWQSDTVYYKNNLQTGTYNTGEHALWITTAPELQTLCSQKSFGRKEGLNLRLEQLLGLPPNAGKKFFIEFWVQPQDLFRPCLDSEVSEANCTLAFPDDESLAHKKWINYLRLASYYNPEWNKNYPWTQLGYTYDWHPKNKSHIGLSEFVIGKNKEIIVHRVYTTDQYCEVASER